jgi:hypothetical protein
MKKTALSSISYYFKSANYFICFFEFENVRLLKKLLCIFEKKRKKKHLVDAELCLPRACVITSLVSSKQERERKKGERRKKQRRTKTKNKTEKDEIGEINEYKIVKGNK